MKPVIIVFCLPFYGHVNPISGIVKALTGEYRVIVYSTGGAASDYAEKVFTEAGAEFKLFGDYGNKFVVKVGKDTLTAAEMLLDVTEEMAETCIDALKKDKPALILHDAYFLLAKIGARKIGVPAVSIVTTFVISPEMILSYPMFALNEFTKIVTDIPRFMQVVRRYQNIVEKYKLESPSLMDMFLNQGKLNVVFTSRELQPKSEILGDNYVFIGPSMKGRESSKGEMYSFTRDRPLIYISLGTLFNHDEEFFKMAVKALVNTPYNVLISTGNAHILQNVKLPENIRAVEFVDQIEVLQKAALFVTHAGMNSINESLYYKVPMVLLPIAQEQLLNALRIEEVGCGKRLQRQGLSAAQLRETVEDVMEADDYRKNVNRISKTLHEAGGIKKAAAKIEKMVEV